MLAVDGVSLKLEAPGQALGLIGESGSGKSSLLLALTRALPKNVVRYEGAVRLQGRDLMQLSDAAFRREVRWKQIAVVFQGAMNAFNPVYRIGFQVAERLLLEGRPKQEAFQTARGLLERVGLPPSAFDRFPHELSGGMKQRAAIAMALTLRPALLLLDEPTSALDVSVQAQIMNLLKELKKELGLAMIFITHDIALASDISDQIAVMHGGEVRELGPADAVLADPKDPYTQSLLASIPRLRSAAKPRFLSGSPPDLVSPPRGCRFAARCERAFGRCWAESPPLLEVGPGRRARCWLHAEGAEQERPS